MVYLRLFSQDKMNWVMAGFILLWTIFIMVFYAKIKNKDTVKQIPWKLLCSVPAFICVLHFLFFHFKGRLMLSLLSFGGFYLSAIIVALFPLIWKIRRKRLKGVLNVTVIFFTVLGILFTIGYPAATQCGTRNYTHMNYVDSFEAVVKNMQKYDTLLEWKNININDVKDEIMPFVKEAQEKNDEVLFYAAMCRYTYRFFDGHTYANAGSMDTQKKAEKILAGNDYGLSMIRLENGETIAILVDGKSDAKENGITDGTRILKWDGEDIDTAIDKTECIYTREYGRWPVKENEEMFKPIFLAGRGGDEIAVTFLTKDNKEKTVKLSKRGSYRERLEQACESILAKDKIDKKNFDTCMLNDTFGYFRISEEEYALFADIKGYVSGSNETVRKMFEEKIDGLQKKGMKKLIIDVRNNTGGYSVPPLELAGLFSKKDIYINSMAYIHGEKKDIIRDEYVKANGKYADLETIVLTNSRCVSAGDYLVYCMGQCENVKIVGTTVSTGSSQPVGGNCVMSDGICDIRYPQNWMLDKKGERFIDTKEDRISRISLDEKIPLTYQGAMDVFKNHNDYEINYILEND